MSASTSEIAISKRSSARCLRMTRYSSAPPHARARTRTQSRSRSSFSPAPAPLPGPRRSSSTVGGVIQFSGLTFGLPPSAQTMKEPSALIINRRTASGTTVGVGPMYETSQRATIRRIARTYRLGRIDPRSRGGVHRGRENWVRGRNWSRVRLGARGVLGRGRDGAGRSLAHRVAELADAFAQRARDFGQPPGPEHEQGDRGQEDEVDWVLDSHSRSNPGYRRTEPWGPDRAVGCDGVAQESPTPPGQS